jgi:hypothetical protein
MDQKTDLLVLVPAVVPSISFLLFFVSASEELGCNLMSPFASWKSRAISQHPQLTLRIVSPSLRHSIYSTLVSPLLYRSPLVFGDYTNLARVHYQVGPLCIHIVRHGIGAVTSS